MSIWEQAVSRFKSSFVALALASLITALGFVLIALVPAFIFAASFDFDGLTSLLKGMNPTANVPGLMLRSALDNLPALLAAGLAFIVMAILLGTAAMAGLATMAVAAARGQTRLGDFFRGASRYYLRFLGLGVIITLLSLVLVLAQLALDKIPVLGTLLYTALNLVFTTFTLYATLIIPMDDVGPGAALRMAWSGLLRRPVDAILIPLVILLVGLLVMIVPIVITVVAAMTTSPAATILAVLFMIAAVLLLGPFQYVYTAVRYDARVRPTIETMTRTP